MFSHFNRQGWWCKRLLKCSYINLYNSLQSWFMGHASFISKWQGLPSRLSVINYVIIYYGLKNPCCLHHTCTYILFLMWNMKMTIVCFVFGIKYNFNKSFKILSIKVMDVVHVYFSCCYCYHFTWFVRFVSSAA